MTLAFEDIYSKLVEVVTVAHVDDDNSLVQTLSTRFQGLVKILKLVFRQNFEAEVWSLFCCRYLVVIIKFNLGQDSEVRFGKNFQV